MEDEIRGAAQSFVSLVIVVEDIREALAHHVSRAAEKLRLQGGEAGALTVMVRTNHSSKQGLNFDKLSIYFMYLY
ncbi:DinB/UmuC family translesion DNA polymerase [Parazoarcus communis]|uniref:DinB/UmuC family translesion DNA polymerase n=1 Tax=Parazoarcus communis TaxID=41977 RepID=UPI001B7D24D1|nr:hypothetical protein [Parazoarcus communis]